MFKTEGQKLFFFCLCPQSSYQIQSRQSLLPSLTLFSGFCTVSAEKRQGKSSSLQISSFCGFSRDFPLSLQGCLAILTTFTCSHPPSSQEKVVVSCKEAQTLWAVSSSEQHNHTGPTALPREEHVNAAEFCSFFTCSSSLTDQGSMIWASFPDSQDVYTFSWAHIQRSEQHWTIYLPSFAPVSSPWKGR